MKVGAFSMSLNVKDLQASIAFYEKLGFVQSGGDIKHNYIIMKNGETLIGLYVGHIPENTLTFNPGWDQNAKPTDPFDDVRAIQKHLRSAGVKLTTECDETTTGPAYVTLVDPDGNAILIDQHR